MTEMKIYKNIMIIGLSLLVLILMIYGFSVSEQVDKEQVDTIVSSKLTILTFDDNGNRLNYHDLDMYANTLLVSTIGDGPVGHNLKNINEELVIEWTDVPIKISAVLELPITGYSTVYLDGEGQGYNSTKVINFNFEALNTQWRIFNEYYNNRINSGLPYIPSNQFLKLYGQAKKLVNLAQSSSTESRRAIYSNEGLDKITQAWELMLKEYGIQYGKKFYSPHRFLFGVTIDDLHDYEWKLDMAKNQGNDYVRIIFEDNKDFTFENEDSFNKYDMVIDYANSIGLEVMGGILDSELWPTYITVDMYRQRSHNLVNHYKGKISVWEVGNEINGNWIGGDTDPIADSLIVDSINAAAEDIKNIDSNLTTVVTLYWVEGVVRDNDHPLFMWIEKWKKNKNFGKNIDIIALSIYPQYDPVGSAFDIMIDRLHKKFPDKKIMIGEFGYVIEDSQGYWWHSKDIDVMQKELIEQYHISMMGYDYSINGGFWWQFSEMAENDQLYDAYKNIIYTFKR